MMHESARGAFPPAPRASSWGRLMPSPVSAPTRSNYLLPRSVIPSRREASSRSVFMVLPHSRKERTRTIRRCEVDVARTSRNGCKLTKNHP